MKKLIFTAMLCCSLCCVFAPVSNAFIWLFPPSVSSADEDGYCDDCRKDWQKNGNKESYNNYQKNCKHLNVPIDYGKDQDKNQGQNQDKDQGQNQDQNL